MDNYAVLYYCYKNASPLDLFHNPIPSMCSLRKFSPRTPIVVLSCNDNESMFQPYQLTLNFHFAKFKARSEKNQLAYKVIDAYEYLRGTDLDAIIMCDTDIMWHSSVDEIYREWSSHPKKDIMLETGLNTGLFGLRKQADERFIKTWFGLCNLFAQVGPSDVTDYIIKSNYPGPDIHDESTLGVVRKLLGRETKKIWYFPNEYCYLPCIEGSKHNTNMHNVKSYHYMMHWLKMFFRYKYGHEWLLSRIGRTGFFLSIEEYSAYMQEELGPNFTRFANHFGTAHQKEKVWHMMTQMQYYFSHVLTGKKEISPNVQAHVPT